MRALLLPLLAGCGDQLLTNVKEPGVWPSTPSTSGTAGRVVIR